MEASHDQSSSDWSPEPWSGGETGWPTCDGGIAEAGVGMEWAAGGERAWVGEIALSVAGMGHPWLEVISLAA